MNTESRHRVSIVTPSFNGDVYLRGMLDRLQSQTFREWEHIVVDNCSTDATLQILAGCKDPRRTVVCEPDSGQSNAINKGFARATGDILCWLNVDDHYFSDAVLQTVVNSLAAGTHDVVYGNGFWRYEPEGTEKPVWIDSDASNVKQRFTDHLGLVQPAVFWTRAAFDRIGAIDESLHYAMDLDLWCRFALSDARWRHIPEPLVVHRVHADMKTVKQRGRSLVESLMVVLKHFGVVSEPWIKRLVDFYREGQVGLQNDRRPSGQGLTNEQAEQLRCIVMRVLEGADPLLVRALFGQLLPAFAADPTGRLRTALDDLTRCAAGAFAFDRRRFDRCVAELQVGLEATEWRQWPETLQAAPARTAMMPAPEKIKTPELPVHTAAATQAVAPADRFRYDRLLRFRDKYRGQECVVMCNGPSLRTVDFSLLQPRFLIGLNKIYLGTDLIGRLPDLVVCVNKKVLEQSADQFARMRTLKFLGARAGVIVPPDPLTYYFNSADPKAPRFSTNIVRHVHEGWTVTHAALQVAYYMGFRKVVIVGMDHNFPQAAGKPNESQLMEGADVNHFAPNYFGFGQQWDLPDLENSEVSYAQARKAYEADGRLIIDATEQGHCRIFERMSLADALAEPIPRS